MVLASKFFYMIYGHIVLTMYHYVWSGLQTARSYRFLDVELLRQAFWHPSLNPGGEENNRRLAWLGDQVSFGPIHMPYVTLVFNNHISIFNYIE